MTNDQDNDQDNSQNTSSVSEKDDQVNDQVDKNKNKTAFESFSTFILEGLSAVVPEEEIEKFKEEAKQLTEEALKILEFTEKPKSNKEIQEDCLKLKKHNDNFKRYIQPLLESGALSRTLPNVPKSRLQKYYAATKGKAMLYGRKWQK